MLAGGQAPFRHIEMATGWRQDEHPIDGRIVENQVEIRCGAERELLPVGLDALRGPAGRPDNLDTIRQIEKTFRMGQ
jgi:hypothetical protein